MESIEKYCWTSGIMCFIWIRFDMLILVLQILPSFYGILHHSLKMIVTTCMIFHSNRLINLVCILVILHYNPSKQKKVRKKVYIPYLHALSIAIIYVEKLKHGGWLAQTDLNFGYRS